MRLEREIEPGADRIVILDIGPGGRGAVRVESLGRTDAAVRREAMVI